MEGIILTLVFMGLVITIMTSYTKVGISLSVVSTYLYFQVVDFNSWIPIVLFIAGLLLIVAEIFIPDFGLIGILGIASIIGGLYLTQGDFGKIIGDMSIAIVITACLVIYLLKKGYSIANINRFVLFTADDKHKDLENHDRKITVGTQGTSITTLRPSGKASFDTDPNNYYDVLSTQGHISKGTPIVIEKISGTKISVRKV